MIHDFDILSATRTITNSLQDLEGAAIAIEANFYLDRLLTRPPWKERLLSALGGLPFALRTHINNELEVFRKHDITPIFIFNGMDVGKRYQPFKASTEAAELNAEAWDLYNQNLAERAVDTFGSSGYTVPEDFYRFLQSILRDADLEFQVAPYSARGQLAYLAKYGKDYVDAAAGSSELLLFDIDKVITEFDFDDSKFTFVKKQSCVEELGITSPEIFLDACLLSGNSLLPTLPQLEGAPNRRPSAIRQAVEMINRLGPSGYSVCLNFKDEDRVKRLEYLDRFRKTRLAIKHQVVVTENGKVEPFEPESVPSDLHDVIGQRLPDELYYYQLKGAIGPRVLNQLTSGQIIEIVPIDGGDSSEYQSLVQEKLTPIRSTALALLASSLFRVYQYREIKIQCWFDADRENTFNLRDVSPTRPLIDKWNVREAVFVDNPQYKTEGATLSFALQSLVEPVFASSTITKKDTSSPLTTRSEVLSNAYWRFLHLRGYIDDSHKLTPWGNVLDAVISNLPTEGSLEESAVLAVELLRLGLLSSDNMFTNYSGAPIRGSDSDKAHNLLLSRIACLTTLRHNSIGFTGPLSRHLLGYSSMINAVRRSLRDLLEMTLATLFLNGDAERDRTDLTEIGLELPFLLPSDCCVGIAMKHYLDELLTIHEQPNAQTDNLEQLTPAFKDSVKEKGSKEWLPHAEDFSGDLDKAFGLWDAVHAGVKVAAELSLVNKTTATKWLECETWSQVRR